MGYTESYAYGVQVRPHSEARETEAGITEESCVQKKHTALAVVSITTFNTHIESDLERLNSAE